MEKKKNLCKDYFDKKITELNSYFGESPSRLWILWIGVCAPHFNMGPIKCKDNIKYYIDWVVFFLLWFRAMIIY